jgi:hypothetical protein
VTTIYCDRLTLRVAVTVALRRLMRRSEAGTRVAVLDGPPGRLSQRFLALLSCSVEEPAFFAGSLATRTGESVAALARKEAFRVADHAASVLVERSPSLGAMNRRWQRETVRLHLAKSLWLHAERILLRVLAVAALRHGGQAPPILYVRWPAALPHESRRWVPSGVDVRPAGTERPRWKSGRLSSSLWALRQWVRRRRSGPAAGADGRPALLVPQEDDLSLDRSFRAQPHWLGDEAPSFRTIVVKVGRIFEDHLPADGRRAEIDVVDLSQLAAARAESPVLDQLGRDFRRSCRLGLTATRAADALAANTVARLMTTARELGRFCLAQDVRAFLTCENYLLHADAMQVVAGPLGIRTLSYQYANMPNASLPMLATADRMVTFSPLFHSRYTWTGYPPPVFVDAGYVYDSSFGLVEERARARRARLEAAGARFVIGFFDESVQRDKYGWLNVDEYAAEVRALLRLVREDASVGVIFKTQFHQNLQGAAPELAAAMEAAVATGRVEIPARGRHRNVVLPVEVARSSDITLGHAFGGTASLEAALAGCRSVLINACGLVTAVDDLYARADIARSSMADAVAAIGRYRAGDPAAAALGDWTPILASFDPYRDGQSAARMRAILEEAVRH